VSEKKLEVQISNAHKIPIRDWAPPTALSVKVRVTITRRDGEALIYTEAQIDKPITCKGLRLAGQITSIFSNFPPPRRTILKGLASKTTSD
jgi:hypothetical protein